MGRCGGGEVGRWGGELKCYIHTDIHTYRPSDEAGCRGAFAPKKFITYFCIFFQFRIFCLFTL